MNLATSSCARAAISFALIFTAYPALTQQELAPGSRRFPSTQEAAGDGLMLSTLFQQGISTSEGFRHSALGSAGNVTMENLSESLTRLEDNLASLIQSFLTVQRSVFNLEQLQELLVLLLEDILKQTGKTDKVPMKDTTPPNGGADAGGSDAGRNNADKTDLMNGSHDSDSSDTKSSENEDGANESEIAASPGANENIGEINDRNNGHVTGSDVLATGKSQGTHESMSGLNKDINVASSKPDIDTSQVDGKDDSGGDSSEGRNSNSNENYPEQRPTIQRSTHPADIPVSSSQKPQWSEPLMERTSSNTHPRFYDVVNRIASRLGQSFVRKSSPRRLGLMQMNSSPHVKQTESTFEQPPVFQPLEIIPAHESSGITKTKLQASTFPVKVKLQQESVISHGGPLTGPEQSSSLFVEHPEEDYNGIESTGERPTGMINNLVLSNGTQSPVQSDLSASHEESSGHLSLPDIRKKRNVKSLQPNHSIKDNTPSVLISSGHKVNKGTTDSLIFAATTLPINVSLLNTPTTSTEIADNATKYPVKNATDDYAYSNFNREVTPDKQMHHNTESRAGAQEYDVLIASLLTDLSSKLHQHHLDGSQHDPRTDDEISQVDSELNKLIWIPSEYTGDDHAPSGTIKTQVINKKTVDYESRIMSPRMTDKSLQTLSIKTKNLNEAFTDALQHSRKMNHSAAVIGTKIMSAYASTKMNDESPPIDMAFKETITSDINSTHTPNTDEFVIEEVITAQGASVQQNVTNSTYTEWEWLRKLLDSPEFQTVDQRWLTETLALLSLNESIADDFNDIHDRGLALLERKLLADGLRNSVNTETDSELASLTQNTSNDIYGDTKWVSTGDSSASSDDDDDKNKKGLMKVGKPYLHHRAFNAMSKLYAGVKIINDVNSAKSDTDSSEDNDTWNNNSESNEDNDRSIDTSIEGQDQNSAVMQEISNTWRNTDYIIHKSTQTPNTDPQTLQQFQDSPSGLYDKLLARDGQMRHRRSELTKRHRRATEDIVNDAITMLIIPQENGQEGNSLNLQKRQVRRGNNNLHHSHTKSSTVHQYTHENALRQTGSGSIHSSQNESNVSFDHQTNITQNKDVIFQNASLSSLNQDSHKNEMISPQSDLNSPVINPHSPDNRKYQEPNGANPHDVHQTKSQLTHQRASDLQSFQFPLNRFSNHFDRNANNAYTEQHGPNIPEPGDTPSVEEPSVMDLEDILTSLFMTYWHRFYNLYTRSPPQTTPPVDWDVEEEVNTTIVTQMSSLELTTRPVELDANFTSADPDIIAFTNKNLTKADNMGGQL